MNRFRTIPRFPVPYRFPEVRLALAHLFASNPPAASRFDRLLGVRPKFWTHSGRQALSLLLRALDLPGGAGVAVPLYTDSAVFNTVQQCGLTPVFVDVDEQTLTMDPASLSRVAHRVSAV